MQNVKCMSLSNTAGLTAACCALAGGFTPEVRSSSWLLSKTNVLGRLLGAPGTATRNKDATTRTLLGAPGHTTRSKDATIFHLVKIC